MKSVPVKRAAKRDKEKRCLFALVEYYIQTGKAVGSNTLKEVGFPDLSSATIRNYFAILEEEGYLRQHHTSGGRIPTPLAFRLFIDHCIDDFERAKPEAAPHSFVTGSETQDMKEIALFLQRAAEEMSEQTQAAAFFSAPRFDQDYVTDIKLVSIDHSRCLSIVLTSFGQIYTETLHAPHKITTLSIKRIEAYFHARLMNKESMEPLSVEERELAVRFYQEAMARYIVSYADFSQEDIFRTGFSKLLRYPEFREIQDLTSSLSLFENQTAIRGLIRECVRGGKIKCWIGDELLTYLPSHANCSVVAIPYHIGHKKVGAIGIIGPMRLPYRHILSVLTTIAGDVSRFLERNLYKHKITFRTPHAAGYELDMNTKKLLSGPEDISLLEDHREE